METSVHASISFVPSIYNQLDIHRSWTGREHCVPHRKWCVLAEIKNSPIWRNFALVVDHIRMCNGWGVAGSCAEPLRLYPANLKFHFWHFTVGPVVQIPQGRQSWSVTGGALMFINISMIRWWKCADPKEDAQKSCEESVILLKKWLR